MKIFVSSPLRLPLSSMMYALQESFYDVEVESLLSMETNELKFYNELVHSVLSSRILICDLDSNTNCPHRNAVALSIFTSSLETLNELEAIGMRHSQKLIIGISRELHSGINLEDLDEDMKFNVGAILSYGKIVKDIDDAIDVIKEFLDDYPC